MLSNPNAIKRNVKWKEKTSKDKISLKVIKIKYISKNSSKRKKNIVKYLCCWLLLLCLIIYQITAAWTKKKIRESVLAND